jgi:mono/diheme cytochrome c family protein
MKRRAVKIIILFVLPVLMISACRSKAPTLKSDAGLIAYDFEQDANNPQNSIKLNYQQAQGRRIFNDRCVWCHADLTPAGPSNRSNLTPVPPLINDGETFNNVSNDELKNTIKLGGGAVGKSPMMPSWGLTLTDSEINSLVNYMRAVAQPAYKPPPSASQNLER